MKKITLTQNSKIAKTAKFTFNYLHLIMIAAVLLLFSVERAHAQSSSRLATPMNQSDAIAPVADAPIELVAPSTNNISYTVFSGGRQVIVNASKIIQAVIICDLSGNIIFTVNGVNDTIYKSPALNVPSQVVIVKSLFLNNLTASKKIVLN